MLYVTKPNELQELLYIFFFSSGIKLFSLVVLHLDLLFPPNLFLLDLIITE